MLRFKITPNEFAAMLFFMRQATEEYRQKPLQSKPVNVLVMMQYMAKWNNQRIAMWLIRPRKPYTLSIPLPLARALHQDMQNDPLGEWQQIFLNTLDQAITNYRDPLAQAHVIGELVHQRGLV